MGAAWVQSDGSEICVNFKPFGTHTKLLLTVEEKQLLNPHISKHYSSLLSFSISPCKFSYKRFRAWGDVYGSHNTRYVKSSNVLVQWHTRQGPRVYPCQVLDYFQVETSVSACSDDMISLARESTVEQNEETNELIEQARDMMASSRIYKVHTFVKVRWYKPRQLKSEAKGVSSAPILLTDLDLCDDVWWRDEFVNKHLCFVPASAIIGNFIQYPLSSIRDPSAAFFRLIHIPRRVFT